jgi:membrane associated rhomboid family serine protease
MGLSMSDPTPPVPASAPPKPKPPEDPALAPLRAALAARTPRVWATPTVTALAIIAWAATAALGAGWWSPTAEGLLRFGGNYAPRTLGGEWWRLFTATFLHDGPLHLALNLLVLWSVGPFLERLLGSVGFLVVYVLSGLFGSLATVLWNPQIVSVGASGAIFGLYGVTLGFFLVERKRLPASLLSNVRRSAAYFIGFNLLFGLSHPKVDMAAHVGGLVAGFALGALIAQPIEARGLRLHARNLAVAALGLALVVLAVAKLPKPPDLIGEERAFLAADSHGVEAFNAAVSRWNKHEINDAQMADAIDRDVLPGWRAERTRIDQVLQRKLTAAHRTEFDRFARYLRARDEGWTLFIDGLRTTDPEKTKRAAEKQKDAEKVLKELNGG